MVEMLFAEFIFHQRSSLVYFFLGNRKRKIGIDMKLSGQYTCPH